MLATVVSELALHLEDKEAFGEFSFRHRIRFNNNNKHGLCTTINKDGRT